MSSEYFTERVMLTPEMAMQLLEHNTHNRPISQMHVARLVEQIAANLWQFNGDTIKISIDGQVLDGQHRLWACIESKRPVDTIIVRGVERDAFSTIDTIRRPRLPGDVVALMGTTRHRIYIGAALGWLVRWQRGVLDTWKQPGNRIENSDIETAFAANPMIVRAVERAMGVRRVGNPSLLSFLYYIAANRNERIAEAFMAALEDPGGLGVSHPFYQFRAWLTMDHTKSRQPEHVIALAFKAMNAVGAGKPVRGLKWVSQGKTAEAFPTLAI